MPMLALHPSHSALRAGLATAMSALEEALDELAAAVREDAGLGLPLWCWRATVPCEALDRVVQAILALDYREGQSGVDTLLCPAVMGATADTLHRVAAVNAAKDQLKVAMAAMRGIEVTASDPDAGQDGSRPLLRVALAGVGHAALNHRQAVRHFLALDEAPESVSFTWGRLRNIARISVQEVAGQLEEQLARTDNPRRQAVLTAELGALAGIRDDEPLALVKRQPPQVKVNIAFTRPDGGVRRHLRHGATPIFYPACPGATLPRLRPLPEAPSPEGHRLRRRDQRWADAPFLKTVPIHRQIGAAGRRRARTSG